MSADDYHAVSASTVVGRASLRTHEACCSSPCAAFAQLEDHEGAGGEGLEGAGGEERGAVLHLRALAIRIDGSRVVEGQARVELDLTQDRLSGPGSLPAEMDAELAEDHLSSGAGDLLAEARAYCPWRTLHDTSW